MPNKETDAIRISIDGLDVTCTPGASLIQVAQKIGIAIPTLCHHDALEPAGACRLCTVEEVRDGWSKFVTACNYPVKEGMVFQTSSPKVIKYRQMAIESLLGRCPDVPVIKEHARRLGVETSRFANPSTEIEKTETCILCGMCTRACDAYSTSAIAPIHRGNDKKIGTFVDAPPEDCIGCGACAMVCPTDHIPESHTGSTYQIWDREFPLEICSVDQSTCIGCGTCEKTCPFGTPRVSFTRGKSHKAFIREDICRGCGVCAGACPAGAITQRDTNRQLTDKGTGLLVIACPRNNLGAGISKNALPANATLLELPCTGAVSIPMLMGALAKGFDGVLVLGRTQELCRLNGAEDHAMKVVSATDELATLAGLGTNRVTFVDPKPGFGGPLEAIETALAALSPTPLQTFLPKSAGTLTLSHGKQIIRFLQSTGLSSKEALNERADALLSYQSNYHIELSPRPSEEESDDSQWRIQSHPVLPVADQTAHVEFTFNGAKVTAKPGEMISTALFANGITIFGKHHRDGGTQGIFCANGQCSQCAVVADDVLIKSCMVPATPGMRVQSANGLTPLPEDDGVKEIKRPADVQVPVLILGGGPAGLSAAIELGQVGIRSLVVDDKPTLGGKLTLQTHGFFGSVADCWAGTRGTDIGHILSKNVEDLPNVEFWLNSTAVGIFNDGKVGVVTPKGYQLVSPEHILVATGAREKALSFPGSDLPGVYGAGAFQTLVNRDMVKAASKLFILGGGNVGLIGGYHALQANIDVVGLVEGLPECGGYKVHADKLKRLGVPIWTSHTIVKAWGKDKLEKVTIAQVDSHFNPMPGTEQTYEADTLLIAVGLSSVDEILGKAKQYNLKVHAAGDSQEVAEASAAIFSGRIEGRKMAREMGIPIDIPEHWEPLAEILRSRPGKTIRFTAPKTGENVYPVIRCVQEIPCNPCSAVCPENLIKMAPSIMDLPEYTGNCVGCGRCVSICPGLAINLVHEDYDPTKQWALLTVPFEFLEKTLPVDSKVQTVDMDGKPIGEAKIIGYRDREDQDHRKLVMIEVPFEERHQVAGFTIRGPSVPVKSDPIQYEDDPIVCRCERVRKSDITKEIRAGVRDINQLKALVRLSMGGCGGKTCTDLLYRIYREEGIPMEEITPGTIRPLIAETPLGIFAERDKGDA